jgi:ATP-binding cassette subfamily B protein
MADRFTRPTAAARAALSAMPSDLAKTARLVWQAAPWQVLVLVALTGLSALVPAFALWIGKLLIDAVARAIADGGRDAPRAYRELTFLLSVQVSIGALGVVLGTASTAVRELLTDRLQNYITLQILEKAAGLEVESFERTETYDQLRNAYAEVGFRPLSVVLQCLGVAQGLVTVATIGGLMTMISGSTIVFVIAATVPGVMVSVRFGMHTYRMLRHRAPDARFQNYVGSLLTSDVLVKEVRVLGFERYLIDAWTHYYRKFRSEFVPLLRRRSLWSTAASLSSTALIALATLPVLRRAADGATTVGTFSLFVGGIAQLQSQLSGVLGSISGGYENLLYMRNLFEFLDLSSRDLDAGEQWQGPITQIEFDHVGFRYPLTERDVLHDVSFRISRGETLAIVGDNGAGKTTIIRLLTRLFEPTSGRILLNGVEAHRFSPRSVQREVSLILQDYGQYQMTVRENIVLGHPDAIDDQPAITVAAQKAGAAPFVDRLPSAYSTMLGRLFPGGVQLSGGQWQRLALARMYFRPASVQVFDEPTAAQDASSEAATIERVQAEGRSRITVIVSHRFSTVRQATHILVLRQGAIVESGSHDELMAMEGTYSRLFDLQARGYRAAAIAHRAPV